MVSATWRLATSAVLGPQMQNQARKVLSKALRRAEQEGFVARNAASLADAPRLTRPEGRSLTPEQARALLAALDGERMGIAYAGRCPDLPSSMARIISVTCAGANCASWM
jgi:hypothetical protein